MTGLRLAGSLQSKTCTRRVCADAMASLPLRTASPPGFATGAASCFTAPVAGSSASSFSPLTTHSSLRSGSAADHRGAATSKPPSNASSRAFARKILFFSVSATYSTPPSSAIPATPFSEKTPLTCLRKLPFSIGMPSPVSALSLNSIPSARRK